MEPQQIINAIGILNETIAICNANNETDTANLAAIKIKELIKQLK